MADVFKITEQSQRGYSLGSKFYESVKTFERNYTKKKGYSIKSRGRVVGYQHIDNEWVIIHEYTSPDYDDQMDTKKKFKNLMK